MNKYPDVVKMFRKGFNEAKRESELQIEEEMKEQNVSRDQAISNLVRKQFSERKRINIPVIKN